MTDDYELMPAVELEKLRREIELLKRNPFGAESGKSAQESMDNLTTAINKLVQIFSSVEEDMINEVETMKTSQEHFQDLKNQNAQMAEGIVKVADLLENQPAQQVQSAPIETPADDPFYQEGEPAQQQFAEEPPQEVQQTPPPVQDFSQAQEEPQQTPPASFMADNAPQEQQQFTQAQNNFVNLPSQQTQQQAAPAQANVPDQNYAQQQTNPNTDPWQTPVAQQQAPPQQAAYDSAPAAPMNPSYGQNTMADPLPPIPEPITPAVPQMPPFQDPFGSQELQPYDQNISPPTQDMGGSQIAPPNFGQDSLGGLGGGLDTNMPPLAPSKEKRGLFGLFK